MTKEEKEKKKEKERIPMFSNLPKPSFAALITPVGQGLRCGSCKSFDGILELLCNTNIYLLASWAALSPKGGVCAGGGLGCRGGGDGGGGGMEGGLGSEEAPSYPWDGF